MTQARLRLKVFVPALTLGFVIAGVTSGAQQRPAGGPAAALTVDFIAVGADGQPVPDLKPGDVSIRIAGKNRTISSLELKRAAGGGGAAPGVAPPFAVNTPSSGRSFLIVVDAESLRAGTERAIRDSLEALFKSLGSGDRVAFSIAPRDTAQVGFGAGLAAVRDALGKMTGLRPANVTATDRACRTRDSLTLLRSLVDRLAGSESPTSVLFIAGGLELPSREAGGAGQSCEVTPDHYQSLAAAAAMARANIYVVQGDEATSGRDDGLENLAGVTNAGAVMRVTGSGLARVINESAAYYAASVQLDPSDRPGQPQRLEVRVNREGVTVHARPEFAMSLAGGAGRSGTTSPRDMLRTTTAFADLQLRSTAVVSRGAADRMMIFVLTEPVAPETKLTGLTVGLVDPSGKLAFQSTADEKQLAAKSVAVALAAPAGKYRLRVAAVDSAGKSGAVDQDLNVDLTPAGPLKLGGILLVAPRGDAYAPALQFSDDEIAMQLEMYGQITAQVSAKIEVAATADGPALVTVQPGGQGTSEPDKFVLSGKIPIAKLAPGDYVVRAIVQLEGQPEGRVLRTLRKIAK